MSVGLLAETPATFLNPPLDFTDIPISPGKKRLVFPDSDGKLMAENSDHFRKIVELTENLESRFRNQPDVFVIGDLLWYPDPTDDSICQAPDVMVVFNNHKGDRGSYKQWEENNVAPQFVFEVRSPSNSNAEMQKKQVFYNKYGAQEYYVYDPKTNVMQAWLRVGGALELQSHQGVWVSGLTQVRLETISGDLVCYHPDGTPFRSGAQKDDLIAQKDDLLTQKDDLLTQKDDLLAQKDDLLAQKEDLINEKDERIMQLEALLKTINVTIPNHHRNSS